MRRIVELILAVKILSTGRLFQPDESAQIVRKNRQSRKYVQDAGDRTIFRLKFLILYCIHSP